MKNKLPHLCTLAAVFLMPTYLIRLKIGPWPSNLWEILILVALLANLLGRRDLWTQIRRAWPKHITLAILALLAGLGLSAAANGFAPASLGIIRGWFLAPLVLGSLAIVGKKSCPLMALFLSEFGVGLMALTAWLQHDLTYDGRLSSIYLSPNHLAMYLAPGVFIGWHFLKKSSDRSRRTFFAAALIVILTALYLTYSYAAWLAILAGWIIAEAVFSGRKIDRKLLLAIFIGAALILSQAGNPKFKNILDGFSHSSWQSRLVIWESAWKIGSDHWLLGIGAGNFQEQYLAYQQYFPPYPEWAVPQPHNLYLAFWLQSGLLGLAAFVFLIIHWLNRIIRMRYEKTGPESLALIGIVLYLLIHGLVDTTYWKNDLAGVFWIVLLLGLSAPDPAISDSTDKASRPSD